MQSPGPFGIRHIALLDMEAGARWMLSEPIFDRSSPWEEHTARIANLFNPGPVRDHFDWMVSVLEVDNE